MKNLKSLRTKANLTQKQLAKLSGYCVRSIIRFEQGEPMRKRAELVFKSVLGEKR